MGNKYSRLQISIHWLVFLLVIVAYCAMEFRGFFPRSDRPLINMIHVSCGISILVLMVVRLLLRLKYPTPPIIPKEGANKQVISSQADSLIKIPGSGPIFFPQTHRIGLFRLFFPPFLALFPVFTEISPTDVSFGPPETGWPG